MAIESEDPFWGVPRSYGTAARRTTSAAARRVTLAQLARELDLTREQTIRVTQRFAFLGLDPSRLPRSRGRLRGATYPAHAVEVYKALINHPARSTTRGSDWLSQHLTEGTTHGPH